MKKLSLLLLLSVFVFCSCGDDDDDVKNEVVVSFENLLTEENSQFIADGTPNNQAFQETDFKDPKNLINFNHYYADWGSGYSFAGFSYMNITDNQTANSPAPITGKAKIGSVYIGADSTDGEYGTPAILTILDTNYKLKGTWIANSTWAYMGMIQGDGYARAFKAGDWYKVTATGYDEAGNETSKEFTVKVVEPAKLIVEDKVLTVGDKFDPLAGIQVLDVDGTDITKNIIVISDGVDTSKAGSYEVIYRITDALGNEVEFRRMVEVKDIEPDVKPVDPDEQTPSDNSGQQTIPGQVVEAAKTSDDVNITGMFGILVLAGLGWIGSRKRKFCDC